MAKLVDFRAMPTVLNVSLVIVGDAIHKVTEGQKTKESLAA